ncbi:hypothetical protein CLPU_36c00080 [Gottschalkia purinilytica]|uniref:Uncharacterized protein n=1 Tax=Gottschalkia purinilytica TaxID=1503 RepID=A0A0L0W690_GOTPU|nr:hypothetical protein [Gottschalkia purinilytica]KNF06992.1 hypothetical protein CLPU_36c00080 [Gottschalkia purinilytica]
MKVSEENMRFKEVMRTVEKIGGELNVRLDRMIEETDNLKEALELEDSMRRIEIMITE